MLYLAYGSNLLPLRLQERVHSAVVVGTATLQGWTIRFHKRSDRDDSGKATLVVDERSTAHGAVFEIDPVERPALDRVEGLHAGYRELRLDLPIGRVFTYLAEESHVDSGLSPFSWYRSLVVAGARWHRFPSAYVASIADVHAHRDTDRGRHDRHMKLVGASARSAPHLLGPGVDRLER